jgi:antitoxin component HigA of HigAB toxin-antitoxin module
MDGPLILIKNDDDFCRAWALIEQLWDSSIADDLARLESQARLIAAYEEKKWPRRAPTTTEMLANFLDQRQP